MPSVSSLTPTHLKKIAGLQFSRLVVSEIGRARKRIAELQRTYPSAQLPELAQRLTDGKKTIASTSGAVSGLFGLVSVPLDLVLVAYLQLSLMVDIAVLHKVNLKSSRAQQELLDLLGYANGAGPLVRAGPRVFGRIATSLLQRGGLPRLGRAVPVVASPLTAWLNHKAIARAGREAMIFYGRQEKRARG